MNNLIHISLYTNDIKIQHKNIYIKIKTIEFLSKSQVAHALRL